MKKETQLIFALIGMFIVWVFTLYIYYNELEYTRADLYCGSRDMIREPVYNLSQYPIGDRCCTKPYSELNETTGLWDDIKVKCFYNPRRN